MRTFSEIIDLAITTTGYVDRLAYTVLRTNGVIRDLMLMQNVAFDRREVRLEHQPNGWVVPTNFRSIEAVRYNGLHDGWAPRKNPGKVQSDYKWYWYQSGDRVYFMGNPHTVDISYFVNHTQMLYQPTETRRVRSSVDHEFEIRLSPDSEWLPYDANNPTHVKQLAMQRNYMTEQFPDVILEGLLSGMRNAAGDVQRGGRHHQQHEVGRLNIKTHNQTITSSEN